MAFKFDEDMVGGLLLKTGAALITTSLILALLIYYPVIFQEIKYRLNPGNSDQTVTLQPWKSEEDRNQIIPANNEFSIIVPKIGANAKVIQDVDPFNEIEYRQKLSEGVAHAKGSVLPNQKGNTFLFAHSTDTFYNINRYNAVFYLLNKLNAGDEFFIVHKSVVYKYIVKETVIASPDEVGYISGDETKQTATLMTCWPPGTTINRLLVVGELAEITSEL